MTYTLGEAAKATGLTKPTISKAIKSGKLSANKNENGSYTIDPSELHRVYPPISFTSKPSVNTLPSDTPGLPPDLHTTLPGLLLDIERSERDRERQQLNETINDLRKRLDEATEAQREAAKEIRKLTLMLTHQPAPDPKKIGSTALLDRLFKRGKSTS